MPERKLLAGYLISLLRSQKPWNKETQFPTKKLKAMNMLKQRRDNFQVGGKDKLNLKLTVFFYLTQKPDVFFRNAEVLNAGIKCVKNNWNLKRIWITPKSVHDFHVVRCLRS